MRLDYLIRRIVLFFVVVWVAVWGMTAWLNAQLAQKVLRVGWRAMPARRFEEPADD